MTINYNMTRFLTSVMNYKYINITECGIEIALIGYSNSGKSTLINCLTKNSKLSRISKLPGRTNMINFFSVNKNLRLVDLPGYGYSKIYKNKKNNYKLISDYVKNRTCLKGILLLIDIRRLLRKEDINLLHYIKHTNIKIIILLTKCDKFNFEIQKKQIQILKKQVCLIFNNIQIFLFSSYKYIGVVNVLNIISEWFNKTIK